MITKGFYVYGLADIIWTARSYKKAYSHNVHTLQKMLQKGVFMLTVRVFLLYEATEYASMWYLVNQTENIVRKKHPLRDQFADKLKEF